MKEFLLGWYCGQTLLVWYMTHGEEPWHKVLLYTLMGPFLFIIGTIQNAIDYFRKDS